MGHTSLDQAIAAALERLRKLPDVREFDYGAYICAFRKSAQEKAHTTLELLRKEDSPFATRCPVFISIGGGDGEEVISLLRQSVANHGFLIELVHPLAEAARRRISEELPTSKRLDVFEGDAQAMLEEVVHRAGRLVEKGDGDFLAVTCHAVIHELFDRGKVAFDPLRFFGTVFSTDLPTWFTYREPGVPEKWPENILIRANCQPKSLLALAKAICLRHPSLREQHPEPHVVGDHVRLHRTVAMELLAKLFYLTDLEHEIDERSTAVNHTELQNSLWLAIGQTAGREKRANILSISAATDSFSRLWQELGVEALGLGENNSMIQLAVAESQSRIVAWRLGLETATSDTPPDSVDDMLKEIEFAEKAFRSGDDALLPALIESGARAWIESSHSERALGLLELIRKSFPVENRAYLWSHYNICISKLFSGAEVDPDWFSETLEGHARAIGIDLLYKAERMEFSRRAQQPQMAVECANDLIVRIEKVSTDDLDSVSRYVLATSHFLLGNLLRYGGLYDLAWQHVDRAQSIYRPGLASHDTELAHCFYSKQVCIALTGKSQFDAPFGEDEDTGRRRFAFALITLSYSHAAWFMGDVAKATELALEAATRFSSIGFKRYAARANDLAVLLEGWQSMESGKDPQFDGLSPHYARAAKTMLAPDHSQEWHDEAFARLRPSAALGLLQFTQLCKNDPTFERSLKLPPVLCLTNDGRFQWVTPAEVDSFEGANSALRQLLGIPRGLRVPLIAD